MLRHILSDAFIRLVPKSCDKAYPQAQSELGFELDPPEKYCHKCGKSVGPGEATPQGCGQCASRRLPYDRVIRLGQYAPPLDEWIVDMKFHGDWSWASWFGHALARSIDVHADRGRPVVSYVPMQWRRKAHRGYNQSLLIADVIARDLRLPLVSLLRRTRHTLPQPHVPFSRRGSNIAGSFEARHFDLTGFHIWLVDDVMTSGSTAHLCARLLKSQGAQSVSMVVVARGDDRPGVLIPNANLVATA